MFDFDDIAEESEEPPKPVPQPKAKAKPKRLRVLSPIERTRQLPGREVLGKLLQNQLPPSKPRFPRLYVIVFPSAAYPYAPDTWGKLEAEAPEDVEVVVYEWPGVGFRAKEPAPESLESASTDAFTVLSRVMAKGPFVFVAHGPGVPIMVATAERAIRELQVEPLLTFVLDWGPLHCPIWSDYGWEQVKNNKEEWTRVWEPTSHETLSEATLKLIWGGHKMGEYRPVNFYHFVNPLVVAIASEEYQHSLYHCLPHVMEDRKKFTRKGLGVAPFDTEDFHEWKQWGDNVSFHDIPSTQVKIPRHEDFPLLLWKEVDAVIKSFGK